MEEITAGSVMLEALSAVVLFLYPVHPKMQNPKTRSLRLRVFCCLIQSSVFFVSKRGLFARPDKTRAEGRVPESGSAHSRSR
ncbi:hypothetical protein KNP414_03881 [Paenibacillus mucilaginosus KNP414]|uniref:Uncharacterized protein n=1 Tax=Paenibacillus mucilaginosus (strain KNP414) TaxID=1036673 RepID=F8F6E5_PAEMK|nr:hypothetical protein KNP414_03881 [Paenibacillus mucilaginosus KNP414]